MDKAKKKLMKPPFKKNVSGQWDPVNIGLCKNNA